MQQIEGHFVLVLEDVIRLQENRPTLVVDRRRIESTDYGMQRTPALSGGGYRSECP